MKNAERAVELLRRCRPYVEDQADWGRTYEKELLHDIDALLAEDPLEPIYYMRDNHTFKQLSGDVDVAVKEIEAELVAGWTSGMLCCKRDGFPSLHANYRRPREEFLSDCRAALLAELERTK